ncbi:MAG: hypothetical protein LPK45_03550 [Bacteroidota bacterium]|nr:hypothetical protein [Bacteroidota bacterium]MDX5430126.1 hypothetical protein [Bacteroidota bacterium]MDX5468887.1 hypothetical protein [Bacteroidota bacterium]
MNTIWMFWGAREAWTTRRSLENGCLYFPFEDLEKDCSHLGNETLIRSELSGRLKEDQIQCFDLLSNGLRQGDWIIIPGDMGHHYHMGQVTGNYHFEWDSDYGLHHFRRVDWFQRDMPVVSLPNFYSESRYLSMQQPVILPPQEAEWFQQPLQLAVGF